MMSRHTPQHAAPARKLRRLAHSAAAVATGTALVLGGAGVADAKTTTPIPNSVKLAANCDPGFSGNYVRSGGTITLTFKAPTGYEAGGVDVRGTNSAGKTVRFKEDLAMTAGNHKVTFTNVPAKTYIWRVGVTASPTGKPLEDVHALDNEAGPCE